MVMQIISHGKCVGSSHFLIRESPWVMSQDYPQTVDEILNPNRKYPPAVLQAVKAFRASKAWQGTLVERQAKYQALNTALGAAYGVTPPTLVFENDEAQDSGSSCFVPATNTIILRGRLSVVTYLHEFAHFRFGHSERTACSWSINLFARCFPRSFARCVRDGHMLRKPRTEQ